MEAEEPFSIETLLLGSSSLQIEVTLITLNCVEPLVIINFDQPHSHRRKFLHCVCTEICIDYRFQNDKRHCDDRRSAIGYSTKSTTSGGEITNDGDDREHAK